jgi:hypothetical protein
MFEKNFLLGIEARRKTEPDINAYFRLLGCYHDLHQPAFPETLFDPLQRIRSVGQRLDIVAVINPHRQKY